MSILRRLPAAAVLLLATLVALDAQSPVDSTRELATEALLAERGDAAAFDRAITAARAGHVSEQAILEARFLYQVDANSDDALVALLPELRRRRNSFVPEESAVFAVAEDWQAIVEYVEALAALKAGSRDEFKKHITEAFWLSPRQAAVYAPHIERLRLTEAMAALRLDLTTTLQPQSGGAPTTLANLLKDKKAIVLHFWSPLSPESQASMPDFNVAAKALAAAGIPVVSILITDANPQVVVDAVALVAKDAAKAPAVWLCDNPLQPLARPLRIQEAPTMVIVASDGRILFNGHPADQALWNSLASLSPGLARPALSSPAAR
jgi:hypothetical protein